MNQNWNKMMKRVLTLALAAVLLAQPTLAARELAFPEGWHSPFSDVKEGQWFHPFVGALYEKGVVSGYTDGRFGPNDPTTAGAALIMILKATGIDGLEYVPGAHWAQSYADYVVARGWMPPEEMPQSLDGAIDRRFVAQVAALALRVLPSVNPTPFADVDDGAITALHEIGVLAGNQEGDRLLFKPDSAITRAEISAIVYQIMAYSSQIRISGQVVDVLAEVPVNSYKSGIFALQDGRMTYTYPGVETTQGVDVSAHQGSIDWSKVAADGIDFAMIRVGGRYYGTNSGTIYEDTRFHANMKGALAAGLETGVYFFSQAITVEEAREEARFALEQLKGYEVTGPVVFDWERISYDSARTDNVDSATLTAMAQVFCEEVERAGYQPMLYFNPYTAYLLYDLAEVTDYPFWLAQYSDWPGFYYDFQMWQYTDQGTVDGISGKVDLNIRLTRTK